jgi:agmatinase
LANELPYNFGGLPVKYSALKNSKIIVLPVPFDKTSSWMKGSDKGPNAIINASRNMELYDIETIQRFIKASIQQKPLKPLMRRQWLIKYGKRSVPL